MENLVIETSNLTRRFGAITAVDNVNFRVRQGEIFGCIGPNGSGKTTTIRMLCGIIAPSSGSGRVGDFDIIKESEKIKSIIGYTAQRFSLYEDLTVEENIEFFSHLYDRPIEVDMDALLTKFAIQEHKKRLAGNLSGGMKQKLALACSVAHQPKILFLDEPTAGVDPISSREIWALLYELTRSGMTVFITTHYMNEAERCHRLSFIHGGRIIALGSPQELKKDAIKETILEARCVGASLAGLVQEFQSLAGVIEANTAGEFLRLTTRRPDEVKKGVAALAQVHKLTVEVQAVAPSLEDVFVNLTRYMQNEKN